MVLIAWKNNRNDPSGDLTQPLLCLIFHAWADSYFLTFVFGVKGALMRPRTQYQRLLTHSQPQEISYSFSFCHLGVPHNRVILCCHMLQLHKTNNLFTGYKDHKETRECERCKSSFVHDQHKWGDRPSLETPLFEVPPGQVVLHRERGFCELWECSRM